MEKKFMDAASKRNYTEFFDLSKSYILLNIVLISLNPINDYLNYVIGSKISKNIKTELFDTVLDSDIYFFE